MGIQDIHIETVTRDNFEKVLPLIADYQRFYGCAPDTERNRAYFSRFLDDHTTGILFAAFDGDGEILGFATLYFIPSSLSARTACTFNDLYAVPGERGRSVGPGLGFHALRYASDRGYPNASWLTKPDNQTARKIYDNLGASRSEWIMYEATLASGYEASSGS